MPRTCNDLGVCRATKPPCPGCVTTPTPPTTLAPGVIFGFQTRRRRRIWWLRARVLLLIATGTTGLAFAASYLWGTFFGA